VSALFFVNFEQVYYRYILRQVDIQDYLLTRDCIPFVQLKNLILRTKSIFYLIVICITTHVYIKSVTYSVKSHKVQIMRN